MGSVVGIQPKGVIRPIFGQLLSSGVQVVSQVSPKIVYILVPATDVDRSQDDIALRMPPEVSDIT